MKEFELKCDVHTHTIYSRHAYSTVLENLQFAKKNGIELLGITDHFSIMLFPDYQDGKNYQYFYSMDSCWPSEYDGVKLLNGVEADIVDMDGHLFGHDIYNERSTVDEAYERPLSIGERVYSHARYVIASVHGRGFIDNTLPAANTMMYLKAMEQDKVLIIGHPGRSGVNYDIDEVVKGARDRNVLIEINEHSRGSRFDEDGECYKIALACMKYGAKVAVNSDAHICMDIGMYESTRQMLSEIDFPQELIATRNAESFMAALEAKNL